MSNSFAFVPGLLPANPVQKSTTRQAAKCSASPVSRRSVLRLMSVVVPCVLLPAAPARSENTYEKNIRLDVALISDGREKAKALKSTAETWTTDLKEDDVLYVLRFIPIWLEPTRIAIGKTASQENVDVGDQKLLTTDAAAMLGHLLELRQEAKSKKRDGVVRELDEFIETADDFLARPGIQRFKATAK